MSRRFTLEELKMVYDLFTDSLEDGLTKRILSSDSYKKRIYAKINDEYAKLSKCSCLVREMCGKMYLLPFCNLTGKHVPKMKDGQYVFKATGDLDTKFEWTSNEEIVNLLLR